MSKRRNNSSTVSAIAPKRCFFVRNLWLITLAAFLLRLGVSWELATMNGGRNSVCTPSKLTDLATYIDLSTQIANGTFQGEFYYQPYYYAVFLPLLRILFGGSPYVVIFWQSLAGALAVLFAGLTARLLLNRTAGYAAAVLTAISTPLLLYTPYCQNETLQAFHLALLAYCAVRMLRGGSLRWVAVTGLVLGIATLTRGNAMLFWPGMAALLIWSELRRKARWRHWCGALLLFGACYLAPQIPFIVHNSRVRGTLTGPSTAANAVLALGNTPEAPAGGRNPGLPAGPMEYPETWHDFMARAAERPVAKQMLDYLLDKPAEFLELQFRKTLLFWDYREIPNNVSLYGEGEASRLIQALLPGRSALVLTLALSGMIFFAVRAIRRRRLEWLLLYYLVICYWGATALFYILSRFRAPILPLAAVFGGMFLARMWRARRRKPVIYSGAAALVAATFVVVSANDLYREHLESAVMRLVRPEGIRYQLKDGRMLRLDHGPFTGGGWESAPIQPGLAFAKTFAGMPAEAECEVEWSVLVSTPGSSLQGTINGVPIALEGVRPGIAVVKAVVPVRDGKLDIAVSGVSGEIQLLYDRQRNYAPERQPGEPILRLHHR